jgi:hypothetical protein
MPIEPIILVTGLSGRGSISSPCRREIIWGKVEVAYQQKQQLAEDAAVLVSEAVKQRAVGNRRQRQGAVSARH